MRDKNKRKIVNAIEYLAIVSMIVASATPLNSLYYTQTAIIFLTLSVIVFFVTQRSIKKIKISSRAVRFAFAIIVLIFFTALINFDRDINYYLGLTVLIIGSIIIVCTVSYESFLEKYCNVFAIIACYSSALTIFFNIFRNYTYDLPMLYQKGQTLASWRSFYNIYYLWDIYARFLIIRNSACFREPGVWGCFAVIALVLKISQLTKKQKATKWDKWSIVFLCLGIFLSFSTTAWICLAVAFAIYYFEGKHTARQLLIFSIIIITSFIAVIYFQDLIFSKLFSTSASNVSLLDRVAGVSQSIKCFLQAPILGVGYTNYFSTVDTGVNAISYLFLLGEFGIINTLTRIYMEYHFAKNQELNSLSRGLLFLIIIICLSTQNLISMPIFFVMELYGVSKKTRRYQTTKYNNISRISIK